jgi:multidrug efflux pump subunit AcrA (membrane-fusion protein)
MKKKTITSLLGVAVIAGGSLLLFACDGDKSDGKAAVSKGLKTLVVKKTATTSNLYYNGIIEPIKTTIAVSPVEGYVESKHFEYGSTIKKDQLLVTINSDQLATHFRSAISDYLTQKQSLGTKKMTYDGSRALYEAGIETKVSYLNTKSDYETALITFFQKKMSLQKILHQVHMPMAQIEKLSISDTKAVNNILARKFSHMPVYAKAAGVALFPTSSEGESSHKMEVGSSLKEGQMIVSIGDLSGFSVRFKVSEVEVNRLAPGLPVTVSGASFPGIVLKGKIDTVASQADASQSGNTAQFNVKVVVPHVVENDRKQIHIGMTSKVDIAIDNPPAILVPISAVVSSQGQPAVYVLQKDGKKKLVPVQTGQTNLTDVTIISGLSAGDKVVVSN